MQEVPGTGVSAQDKVGASAEKSVNANKSATRSRAAKKAPATHAEVFENPSEESFPPPSLCNVYCRGGCLHKVHGVWKFSSPILWFLNFCSLFNTPGLAYMSNSTSPN
jgi:hypothetical protein